MKEVKRKMTRKKRRKTTKRFGTKTYERGSFLSSKRELKKHAENQKKAGWTKSYRITKSKKGFTSWTRPTQKAIKQRRGY